MAGWLNELSTLPIQFEVSDPMATTIQADPVAPAVRGLAAATGPNVLQCPEHTVEIVSDSGEGAQKCGQIFGAVSAKMGNGAWTVEIIPAEIQPPARTPDGASGNRIRIASKPVTNWGDRTNLVIAFNEQVLLSRHRMNALASDAVILVENMWATDEDETIRAAWAAAMEELNAVGYRIIEVPMEAQCLTVVDNARKGKNMFALGVLSWIYRRDLDLVREQIAYAFRKKSEEVYKSNVALLELGVAWAEENLDFQVDVPATPSTVPMLVMNGNQALALGGIAAGMELAAMYPITPATSVSHHLGDVFDTYGGVLHQAEDEIAAIGVAVGASYAGKCAFTITSGPGLALKTEFIGLATMIEVPLVIVDVQRGGPSTGLPTKVEQGDLLAALFGQPGDTPKVVMAPATIEECFHVMVTARRIADAFRTPVIVLSDANLATGVQPFPRPTPQADWFAPAVDQSPVAEGKKPYEWDERTGLSERFIPGRPGGMHVLTGLQHDATGRITYDQPMYHRSSEMRARKLAVLQSMLAPPAVNGDPEGGDLLLVTWGSTKGAVEEAVERARSAGLSVSSTHLSFLSPLPPGLKDIFGRFRKVMTVEINYSDDPGAPYINEENRRRGQLAWLLRATTLVDVDSWARVLGEPIRPSVILDVIRANCTQGGAQ